MAAAKPKTRMNALIVEDLGGGDYQFTVVDRARWAQIRRAYRQLGGDNEEAVHDVVGWLIADDFPELERPPGAPEKREGRILETRSVQTWAVELAAFPHIDRILFVP